MTKHQFWGRVIGMSEKQEPNFNELVGSNIADIRKARGLTQAALAERLSERGLSFQQQTIVKIEKGQRPIRLEEADAIADALDVEIDSLVAPLDPSFNWTTNLIHLTTLLDDSLMTLRESAADFYWARHNLAWQLDRLRGSSELHESIPGVVLNEAETMLQFDPLKVVESSEKLLAAKQAEINAIADSAVDFVFFKPGIVIGSEPSEPMPDEVRELLEDEKYRRQLDEVSAVQLSLKKRPHPSDFDDADLAARDEDREKERLD